MEKFNQKEYIQKYQKEHYSVFKVKLKKEEKNELDKLLIKANLNQAQFLRKAISILKDTINQEKDL